MTPTEIETAAREQYNAIGDSFFSQSAVMNLIYRASMELALKAKVIERTYTTTTVASQREYSYPSNTIAIKRVEIDGVKIDPIDFRDDDLINTSTSTTTVTGTPRWYSTWNFTLYLRPVPSSSTSTLKIYSYNQPQAVTSTSTLEVPELFHVNIVDFVLSEMAAKDKDLNTASYYRGLWDKAVKDAVNWQAKRKRGDGYAQVKDEDTARVTVLGAR